MIPRERFYLPKRSRYPGSHFWVRKWPCRKPWGSKMLDFDDLEPFGLIFVVLGTLFGSCWGPWGLFGVPKLPQTTPRGPPKHPRSVPQGCLGDSPGACIFTCFSCGTIEKHDFPCIFTAGKIIPMAKGPAACIFTWFS